MKVHTIGDKYNSLEISFKIPIDVSKLPRDSHARRFTCRKYWIETKSTTGDMRVCYSSYDVYRRQWSMPQREKYYPFVCLAMHFGQFKKLYFNKFTDVSYLHRYKEDYIFDNKQLERIEFLISQRE